MRGTVFCFAVVVTNFCSPFIFSSPPLARSSDLVFLLQLLRYVLTVHKYREVNIAVR